MKSNPYDYLALPFFDLSQKVMHRNIVRRKTFDLDKIKEVVDALPHAEPEITGSAPAERIISIFLDDRVRLGPHEYIEQGKNLFLERLHRFIEKGDVIQFTIAGFPYKAPVSLKTYRTRPDLGEVLMLERLRWLMEIIGREYQPGARVTIFTEGVLGRLVGVPDDEWVGYRDSLKKLIRTLGYGSKIVVSDLVEMEKSTLDFRAKFAEAVEKLKRLYDLRDPAFMEKYRIATEALYRNMKSDHADPEILMDVYNDILPEERIPEEARRIRAALREKAHDAVFPYLAYLMVRDESKYFESVAPHALPLTVVPRPRMLGIIPLNSQSIHLPYHGVPVHYPNEHRFLIEYYIDVKRSPYSYAAVYFNEDDESLPFYYEADL